MGIYFSYGKGTLIDLDDDDIFTPLKTYFDYENLYTLKKTGPISIIKSIKNSKKNQQQIIK